MWAKLKKKLWFTGFSSSHWSFDFAHIISCAALMVWISLLNAEGIFRSFNPFGTLERAMAHMRLPNPFLMVGNVNILNTNFIDIYNLANFLITSAFGTKVRLVPHNEVMSWQGGAQSASTSPLLWSLEPFRIAAWRRNEETTQNQQLTWCLL